MTAVILSFPGVTPPKQQQLVSRSKTLIVKQDGRRFVVVMHPILSDNERLVRETFGSADVARAYASRIAATYPDLYRHIDDRTGGAA